MAVPRLGQILVDLLVLGLLGVAVNVRAQTDPCSGDRNAIYLPQNGLCLEITNNAKDWIQAQKSCEQKVGDLYRLQDDLSVTSSPRVAACLAAMPASEQLGSSFWIGAASTWLHHWFWVNNTLLNSIRYETTDSTAFETSKSVFEVCSNYLSVDYCVSVCHDDGAAFTIMHRQRQHPCCFCSFRLDLDKVNASSRDFLQYNDPTMYYIAAAREGRSNMIRLTSSETLTETEMLCGVVDTGTSQSRELLSKTCFSQFPFLCSLGNDTSLDCDSVNCQGTQCKFRVRGECVQRDRRPMTWNSARSQCIAAGGDLWTVGKLDDMYIVSRFLVSNTFYWVGATDHAWDYAAESNVFGSDNPDYKVVGCGHMFLERSGVTTQAQWEWADTQCDQSKSYICQYEQTTYTSENTNDVVRCPWPIPDSPVVPAVTTPGGATPAVTYNGSIIPEEGASMGSESSYPIVPIVAACIAAFVIILCAIFMLAYSRRRKWIMKKWRRTRDYVWPIWGSSPTYLAPDHLSDRGFDSLSTAHTDSGSVFVFPDPVFQDGVAYKTLAHAHRPGSRDGSRRNESLDKTGVKESRASFNSERVEGVASPGGGFGTGVLGGEGGGAHPSGDSFPYENLMSASYASLSPRAREYMTLSAHMNIHDDEDQSQSKSLRGKPEVALVTNDVDMNFTVNHAYSRGRFGSEISRSRYGSEISSPRGMDEIVLPMASTVEVPTRAVEESVLLY
ncbi:uncharacterized protein [Littorina saxatilis]|uniref:uncharacterized protein n=1 Tax=Littorina saxatilis TaxID=31220 RepID=UPI0038B4C535